MRSKIPVVNLCERRYACVEGGKWETPTHRRTYTHHAFSPSQPLSTPSIYSRFLSHAPSIQNTLSSHLKTCGEKFPSLFSLLALSIVSHTHELCVGCIDVIEAICVYGDELCEVWWSESVRCTCMCSACLCECVVGVRCSHAVSFTHSRSLSSTLLHSRTRSALSLSLSHVYSDSSFWSVSSLSLCVHTLMAIVRPTKNVEVGKI